MHHAYRYLIISPERSVRKTSHYDVSLLKIVPTPNDTKQPKPTQPLLSHHDRTTLLKEDSVAQISAN